MVSLLANCVPMSTIAILLILVSATMHAVWNLLSKKCHPHPLFFWVATISGAVLLSPFVWLQPQALAAFPPQVWIYLVATGFCMALYYIGLAGAYRAGDISVAYPLARSSPVIVVFWVTTLMGRGDEVSSWCVAGIVLVVGGCFLIPLHRFGHIHFRHYLNGACVLAFVAAWGTAGYSIIDDEALRLLRQTAPGGASKLTLTLMYGGLQAFCAHCWLSVYMLFQPRRWKTIWPTVRAAGYWPVLAGLIIYLAYAMVLLALAYADNVSYVVGFRQLSIPLGTVAGILFLKEKAYRPKLVGTVVVTIGLLLIAVG